VPELAAIPLERLERQITELAAHINAATCRWLLLVGEFDRREGWAEWGCRSCVHWLSYRCGLSPSAARERVRVARRLGALPATWASFGAGELCFSQVRALTRIATEETERDLIMVARHATAAQLDVVVRAYRGVMAYELGTGRPEDECRYVCCHHDDDGALLIHARLPAEEGALLLAALDAGRDAIREGRRDPAGQPGGHADDQEAADGPTAPGAGGAAAEAPGSRAAVSYADALLLMAQTLLSSGRPSAAAAMATRLWSTSTPPSLRTTTRTVAPVSSNTAAPCTPRLPAGSPATPASSASSNATAGRSLSGARPAPCHPRYDAPSEAATPSPASRAAPQRRFLHAPHVDHWARGGRTDLSNLVQLCSHHHRLVHEGGYRVERGPHGSLRFRRPDGQMIAPIPRRPTGRQHHLERSNAQRGLELTHQTCVPCIYSGDKFDLHWVVDNLAETDSRLTGTPPWSAHH
jgi:hypothetical protein